MIEELHNYEELRSIIPEDYLPPEELSRCFVARHPDGRILGYCFIQTIVCIEPLWVDDDVRGSGLAVRLFNAAANALLEGTAREFICHASTPEVANYLERIGMEETGQRTFKLVLKQEEAHGRHSESSR